MSLIGRELPAGYVPGFVCSLETCDVHVWGFVHYVPSFGGNLFFLLLIYLYAFVQIWLGFKYRTSSICLCMLAGLGVEGTGYIGRLLLHNNPFYWTYFVLNLVCLTLAPVFFAAAIYLCLGRIVVVVGEEISWLKPRTYTFIFVACDVFSLLIQAIGGIIASVVPLTNQKMIDLGTHILVAGLSIQVASLTAFSVIGSEFALRVYKNRDNLNPTHADIYTSKRFKLFLGGLVLATVCIFTRSVFRVAELSGGFQGSLANNEVSFMVLDGVMIMITCLAFSVLHPGYGFTRAGWAAAAYPFFNKSEEAIAKDKAREERREARRQAIVDASEKRFNRGSRAVPTTESKRGENTAQVSDGSVEESQEKSQTIEEVQEVPQTEEKSQDVVTHDPTE
ncbi:hypothetical protein VE02_10059 [Pseudogymnoascus sp. 03VT05]|nr:hypothetical protein VE02_10059 [Pseudogymnoascus sp. 03VT05]